MQTEYKIMQIQSEQIIFCMRFKYLVSIKYNAFKKIVIKFDFALNNFNPTYLRK